jgi:FAD:protein FMN transferase
VNPDAWVQPNVAIVSLCAFSVSSVSLWVASVVSVSLWLAPVVWSSALTRFEFSQAHMGTTVRIVLFAPDRPRARVAADAAFARIAALDATLSDYRDDSEISRLSREAVRRPFRVSDDLFRVLEAAQGLAVRTNGAFDITIGPLSRLWRRARRQIEFPSTDEMAAARAVTGYRLLTLDATTRTASLDRTGMRLDAGGIAKGFAADEALAVLRHRGLRHSLVAVGGDLAVGEAPPGASGWHVVLAGLSPDRAAPGSPLTLTGVGVSTSGDAEQWVEIDGERYSHIVDPSTGLGLTGHRSVSVVAGDAMTSDMLATAVSVLKPDDGIRLVDATPDAAVLVGIASEGTAAWRRSRAWRW